MAKFKYKVGDRVKIQSLEQYNKYKNRYGNINYGCETEILFTSEMSSFCGQVVTITRVRYIGCVRFYYLEEDKGVHLWVDGMFEKLVERNGKTYPYKIGDRVILKGNDRCATITDLKYNSWGNLSYYIKIDNDKDISTDYPTELLLPYNNMSECKMEEEKNGESKPKYEDEKNGEFCSTTKYLVRPSGYQFVDENGNIIDAQKIVLKKLVEPKFKKGDKIKDKNNRVWYVVKVGNRHFDISRIPSKTGSGYFVPIEDQDYYELCTNRELPKTYEECCKVLDFCGEYFFTTYEEGIHLPENDNNVQIHQTLKSTSILTKLIICRNAYWKIYGEENGLGKPWEPDWKEERYIIYRNQDDIIDGYRGAGYVEHHIFEFPFKEMRDAFKKNFGPDIEICKELL